MEASIVEVLDPRIQELLKERGWPDLTDAQKKSIPYIYEGYNVLLIAPTGYGKTEAVLLPILSKMINEDVEPVAMLYITPLRALINNLVDRIKWWASRLGILVARKHGDVPQSEKTRRLRKAPHIMVLTPESLEIDLDWASKFRKYYKNVQWVVVDEVHELASSKRGVQLSLLLERLRNFTGRDFQVIGLSATVESPKQVAEMIFGSSKRRSRIVEVDVSKEVELEIDLIDEGPEFWDNAARRIVEKIEPPALVFVNSRFAAERLHESLEKMGIMDVFVHHSSVSRDARERAEEMLRKGNLRAIVCTKTLELGIDVGDIRSVVLFRSPGSVASLLQRVGRSGHSVDGKSKGIIISVGMMDLLESLALSRLALRGSLEPPRLLDAPLDVLARMIMGICLQKGNTSIKEVYRIAKGSVFYKNLRLTDLESLVKYLEHNNIIARSGDKLKLSYGFYKIWRFNNNDKKWWAKNFTEFFSLISERDSFVVKYGKKIIGDLDSNYVYRHLRVGDVIRLSGRPWRIVDIDESTMKIDVIPAENGSAEIPLWRSEGFRKGALLAREVDSLLHGLINEDIDSVFDGIRVSYAIRRRLEELVEYHSSKGIPLPSKDTLIVERQGDEHFFIGLMGQEIAEVLAHVLMHLIASRESMDVFVRTSYYGFSVKTRTLDPLELLLSIDPDELPQLLEKALSRSPLLYSIIRDIQISFGKIGRPDPEEDEIVFKEAAKQVMAQYLDVEGARKYLEKLKRGRIKIIRRSIGPLTPFSLELRRLPYIRPWTRDSTIAIIKSLRGMAYTVDELADVVELPPRTIESRLKELRKPGVKDRVFQFIDVEFNEWRWALVDDAEEIASAEEFSSSFEPEDPNEAFLIMLKHNSGESYYSFMFTPRDILRDPRGFLSKIPYEEIYEVKVSPLSDNLLKSLAPKYYHVPRSIVHLIALNAVTYLQKLKSYG